MRLREFTRPESIEAAAKILLKAGYNELGAGAMGRVFARKGDPYVLKLYRASDTGYTEFVEFTQANPSKHWPVFKGKPIRVTRDYMAVRTERLYKGRYAQDWAYQFHNYASKLRQGERIFSTEFQKFPQDLQTAIDQLVKAFPNYMLDLGNGNNLMQRKDGTYVITDPIAFKF